jgi:hypothetical protein
VVGAMACNELDTEKTIDLVVLYYNLETSSLENRYVLKNFPLKAKETKSLIAGKMLLQGADFDKVFISEKILVRDSSLTSPTSGLSVNFSILESNNG